MIIICSQDANRFWPGLGGSDIDYAWAKMAQPLFEVLTMPFAAVAIKRVPITATVLLSLLLFAVGGLVYALAVNVWMVLTGKSFFGVAITLGLVSTHVYFGEMGAAMDEIRRRKNKKPLKFIIYVSYTFTFSGGLLASAGTYLYTCISA